MSISRLPKSLSFISSFLFAPFICKADPWGNLNFLAPLFFSHLFSIILTVCYVIFLSYLVNKKSITRIIITIYIFFVLYTWSFLSYLGWSIYSNSWSEKIAEYANKYISYANHAPIVFYFHIISIIFFLLIPIVSIIKKLSKTKDK